MMEQYWQVKEQHQEELLFYRFGDFYEMFFDDAAVAARELDIVLTARAHGKGSEKVPMCGVPHHRLEPYLTRLVEKGYKVAVCEQLEGSPKRGKRDYSARCGFALSHRELCLNPRAGERTLVAVVVRERRGRRGQSGLGDG